MERTERKLTRQQWDEALDRIYEVTGTRTQVELSVWLGIRQSNISDAKRRGNIPAAWLLEIVESAGVAPGWILTGAGPRYLVGSDTPGEVAIGHWTRPEPPAPEPRTVPELQAAMQAQPPSDHLVWILPQMVLDALMRNASPGVKLPVKFDDLFGSGYRVPKTTAATAEA